MKKMLCLFQIVLLLTTPFSAYAGGCADTCTQIENAANAANACTGPDADGLSCEDQQVKFSTTWGQVGSHCEAMNANKKAAKAEQTTALAYTVTAAVCTTACLTTWAGNAMQVACTVSGLGSGIMDIAESLKLGQTVGVITGAIAAGGSAYVAAGQIGNALAQSSTAAGARGFAGATTQSTGGSVAACYAAGISAVFAVLKYLGSNSANKSAMSECEKIGSFSGPGTATNPSGGGGGASAPGSASNSSSTSSSPTGSQGGTTAGGAIDVSNFPVSVSPATAGGVNDTFFSQLPNRGQIPQALEEMGTTVGSISEKLNGGMSPGSILGSLPGLSAATAQAFKDLESDLKNRTIQLDGGNPLEMTKGGGGGGAPAAGAGGFGNWNLGGAQAPTQGGAASLGFSGKALTSGDSTDIWHSDFNGSIFQIVSTRIDKSRDQVEKTEWATPLNRMIMGLPSGSVKKLK